MLIANVSLPPPLFPVQVKLKRQRRWREGYLTIIDDLYVRWEILEKNTVQIIGVTPGDQWRADEGCESYTVEKYDVEAR